METTLIFRGGCDLTAKNPDIMDIPSCIAARHDAGIVNREKEHTGVIEIYEVIDERTKDNACRK